MMTRQDTVSPQASESRPSRPTFDTALVVGRPEAAGSVSSPLFDRRARHSPGIIAVRPRTARHRPQPAQRTTSTRATP
jgi:hypothetical protein